MTQDIIDQILANTYTQADALRRIGILKDAVMGKLFGSEKIASAQIPQNIYSYFTQKNAYKLFDEIITEIKKITPLVVYLPFEIPEQELINLGIYLRKDYGKNFLIEVKYDPSLIAGTALIWNGIYKDYSIRQKIADNHEVIIEMLKDYMHK